MRARAVPALALLVSGLGLPPCLSAQQRVSRADVVAAALERGPRILLGRADTLAARGAVGAARAYPNPAVVGGYSKSVPQYHAALDLPLDLPWQRSARIGAAVSARAAARYGFAFERAAIRFIAETTYTRTLAAVAHADLSRRNASDADSLATLARFRRDLGDVSELDVQLAEVSAGQLTNAAADDSLGALGAVLDLQLVMGLGGDAVAIALADTLAPPAPEDSVGVGEPLPVAAAAAALQSQQRAVALARRSRFGTPSLELGFETHDPSGGEPGWLPTVGLSFTLPLFNWSGGAITQAAAARDRAQADLERVRRETAAEVARAHRELRAATLRVQRDGRLLASAERVAVLSLQAYREGAIALPNVLEAQRNARDALGRYIDDVAAAHDAQAFVRLVTASAGVP